jgi:hypothetical protein
VNKINEADINKIVTNDAFEKAALEGREPGTNEMERLGVLEMRN